MRDQFCKECGCLIPLEDWDGQGHWAFHDIGGRYYCQNKINKGESK